jgi:hypothetical protein
MTPTQEACLALLKHQPLVKDGYSYRSTFWRHRRKRFSHYTVKALIDSSLARRDGDRVVALHHDNDNCGGSVMHEGEAPAPISDLSRAQRQAILSCFTGGGLKKSNSKWKAQDLSINPVAGVTVSDLARDGLFDYDFHGHRKSEVRLTERGEWFARTLARGLVEVAE